MQMSLKKEALIDREAFLCGSEKKASFDID